MYTQDNNPYYRVYAANNEDEKIVATASYKQDALNVAKRFLNVSVVRIGTNGVEKEVYAHGHAVPDKFANVLTHVDLKKAKAAA